MTEIPQDTEAERQLLSLVVDSCEQGGTFLDDVLASRVTQNTFFDAFHKRAWGAIAELREGGKDITLTSILAVLNGTPDDRTALLSILNEFVPLTEGQSIITLLCGRELQRTMIRLSMELREDAENTHPMEQESLIGKYYDKLTQLTEDSTQSGNGFVSLGEVAKENLEEHEAVWAGKPESERLPSPWEDFNYFLRGGGFGAGELIIVAAETKGGKTSFCINILHHLAKIGHECLVFSLEMSPAEIQEKILSAETGIKLKAIYDNKLTDEQKDQFRDASNEFDSWPFTFRRGWSMTIGDIRGFARRWQNSLRLEGKRPGIILIDYLQRLDSYKVGKERRDELIGEMTRGAKNMADELGVPILLPSQFNRGPGSEQRRPRLSDLKESSSIEQDADLVLFIHQDKQPGDVGGLEKTCIVAANRKGPPGDFKLLFDGEYTLFKDMPDGMDGEEKEPLF